MTATPPRSMRRTRGAAVALAAAFSCLRPVCVVLAAAPAAPSTPDLATGSDTGSSNTDNITQTLIGLVFTGTAEPGTTVRIYWNGSDVIGMAVTRRRRARIPSRRTTPLLTTPPT